MIRLVILLQILLRSVSSVGNLLENNADVWYVLSLNGTEDTKTVVSDIFNMTSSTFYQTSDAASFCISNADFTAGTFDSFTLVFDLITPVKVRSIMPVLSKATTNYPEFYWPNSTVNYSLSAKYNDTAAEVHPLFNIMNTNKVHSYKNGKIISQLNLTLIGVDSTDRNFSFCVDRVFAFREYHLNSWAYMNANVLLYSHTRPFTMEGFTSDYWGSNPWESEFTRQSDCPIQSMSNLTNQEQANSGLGIVFFQQYYERWTFVTMVFQQLGTFSTNQGFNTRVSYYDTVSKTLGFNGWTSRDWIYGDSSNLHYFGNSTAVNGFEGGTLASQTKFGLCKLNITCQRKGITISLAKVKTLPILTLFLSLNGLVVQTTEPCYSTADFNNNNFTNLCTLQQFGYFGCQIGNASINYNDSIAVQSIDLDPIYPTFDLTIDIQMSYTIEDSDLLNYVFCTNTMSINVFVNSTFINVTSISYDPPAFIATPTINLSSMISNDTLTTLPLNVNASGILDPQKTHTTSQTVVLNYCLTQTDGYVRFANLTNITEYVYKMQAGVVDSFSYALSPPLCRGFQNLTISFTAFDSNTGLTLNEDSQIFSDCQLDATTICLYHDLATQSIQYFSTQNWHPNYNTTIADISIYANFTNIDQYKQSTIGSVVQTFKVNQLTPSLINQCNVTSFYPSLSQNIAKYTIGLGAATLSLPAYNQTPSCGYSISSFIIAGWAGTQLPPSDLVITKSGLWINLNDASFVGQQLVLYLSATLDSLGTILTNKEGILVVNFVASNSPWLLDKPSSPTRIPCIKSTDGSSWSYLFPQAQDQNVNSLEISFSCPSIQGFFRTSVDKQVLKLTLNTNFPVQPPPGNYTASLKLTNQANVFKVIKQDFEINCETYGQTVGNKTNQQINATIASISTSGLVTIQWNADMIVPNLTNPNSTFELFQNLKKSYVKVNVTPYYVNSGIPNFTYAIVSIQKRQMQIQLVFEQPYAVAKYKIMISINSNNIFVSQTGLQIKGQLALASVIPTQTSKGEISFPTGAIATISLAGLVVSFITSYFLQAVVNKLLSFIDSLILIVHISIVSLNYPVNLTSFFSGLFPFVTFDVLPTSQLYQALFNFDAIQDHPFSNQFNLVGYNNSNFSVSNLNSIFLIMTFGPAIYFVLWFISKENLFWRHPQVQLKVDTIVKRTVCNGFILFFAESYVIICTTAFIGIKDLRLTSEYTSTEIYCSLFSLFLVAYIIVGPLVIAVTYFRTFKSSQPVNFNRKLVQQYGEAYIQKLEKYSYTYRQHDKFMEKYGTLVESYDIKKLGAFLSITTALLSILRQFFVAQIIVQLVHRPMFATFCIHALCLSYCMFVIYHLPKQSKFEQVKSVCNEVTLLILNYHMLLFTNFVQPQNYGLIGNSLIYVIVLNMALNLVVTGLSFSHIIAVRLRKTYFLYKMFLRRKKGRKEKHQSLNQKIVSEISQNLKQIKVVAKEFSNTGPYERAGKVQTNDVLDAQRNSLSEVSEAQISKEEDSEADQVFIESDPDGVYPSIESQEQKPKPKKDLAQDGSFQPSSGAEGEYGSNEQDLFQQQMFVNSLKQDLDVTFRASDSQPAQNAQFSSRSYELSQLSELSYREQVMPVPKQQAQVVGGSFAVDHFAPAPVGLTNKHQIKSKPQKDYQKEIDRLLREL